MSQRKSNDKLIVANWKMNLSYQAGLSYAKKLLDDQGLKKSPYEIALCPDHLSLAVISKLFKRSRFSLGAQNAAGMDRGAQTGDISPLDLKALGLKYVILGHSERRALGERPSLIAAKIRAALKAGLVPIVCLGEKLMDRESGETRKYLNQELRRLFSGLKLRRSSDLIIAYEPVWAISTVRQARPLAATEANAVHEHLKKRAAKMLGKSVRIIYGGSVNGQNAAELLGQPQIGGLLVGAASLDINSFGKICRFSASGKS